MEIRLFLCILIGLFFGCSSNNGASDLPPPPAKVDVDKLLVDSAVHNAISPKVRSLTENTAKLNAVVVEACESQTKDLSEIQEQWKAAMLDFHYLDAVRFGPLEENGGDRRNQMYAWPEVIARGRLKRNINAAFNDPDEFEFNKTEQSVKGFDALEYILFEYIGNPRLGPDEIACPYLKLVMDDLVERTEELEEAWKTSVVTPLVQEQATAYIATKSSVYEVMFYVDTFLKHLKLAPALKDVDPNNTQVCQGGVRCLEHRWAKMPLAAIKANIEAYRDIFSGVVDADKKNLKHPNFGFTDFIGADAKHLEKASFYKNKWAQVLADLEAVPSEEEFVQLASSYNANDCTNNSLCGAYRDLKEYSRWLKTEFKILIGLDLPGNVQGDND